MQTVKFNAGDTILSEGEDGDTAFLIIAGSVEVSIGQGSNAKSVGTLNAGEVFGEMSLIDPGPRSATVKAASNTECFVTTYDEFIASAQANPERAVELMKTLVRRLRHMNERMARMDPGMGHRIQQCLQVILAGLDERDAVSGAEMEALQRYLAGGKGVVGLRTSSHAFSFDPDSKWASWNEGFGRDVLGSPWSSHHGHSSSTDVTVLPDAPAELVAGLPQAFHVRSWLYRTELQPWCRPVLFGVPVEPESDPTPGPVAWIGMPEGRRTFYTSLGHPDDFDLAAFRALLRNGAAWTVAEA